MVREIIMVNIGGCGINLGALIWKQFEIELKADNSIIKNQLHQQLSDENKYEPLNIMIDTEQASIDNIRNNKEQRIFNTNYLLSSKRNGLLNKSENITRKLVEQCDNIEGFMINRSIAGKTGGVFGSSYLKYLGNDYKKKATYAIEIFPESKCN
eukprot:366592_1